MPKQQIVAIEEHLRATPLDAVVADLLQQDQERQG